MIKTDSVVIFESYEDFSSNCPTDTYNTYRFGKNRYRIERPAVFPAAFSLKPAFWGYYNAFGYYKEIDLSQAVIAAKKSIGSSIEEAKNTLNKLSVLEDKRRRSG